MDRVNLSKGTERLVLRCAECQTGGRSGRRLGAVHVTSLGTFVETVEYPDQVERALYDDPTELGKIPPAVHVVPLPPSDLAATPAVAAACPNHGPRVVDVVAVAASLDAGDRVVLLAAPS